MRGREGSGIGLKGANDTALAPARIVDGRLVGAPQLESASVRMLMDLLNDNGEQARIVGGAVRNALMGEIIYDIDIATTALPEDVMKRAQGAGLKAIPTGFDHGTVTIVSHGDAFEVTTLREDVETHGRHATVKFGRDFEADALRRDFTINALSVDHAGIVHDYCNGLADAAVRKVRFIGDAQTRIREDYLRILRYFRFYGAYDNGAPEAETLHAVISLRGGLGGLSRERIGAEMMKLLKGRRADDACAIMSDTGILQMLLAGIGQPARLSALMRIEAARTTAADTSLRLAVLGAFVADDADRLREQLRLSRQQETRIRQALQAYAGCHNIAAPPGPADLYRYLFQHGRRAALDGMLLAQVAQVAAGADPADARWQSAQNFLRDTPEPRLPFTGAELMERGLESGPAIGRALKRLQAAWIRAGFPDDPAVLSKLLEENL